MKTQIFNSLNAASPNAFYVMRFFSQTPLNPDNSPTKSGSARAERGGRQGIARAQDIRHAGLWNQSFNRIEYQSAPTSRW